MALDVTDIRNADNARAYGDSDTDVWLGRRQKGKNPELPKSSAALTTFAETYPPLGWLAEDGVPFDTDTDAEDFNALQGSQLIKSKITQTTRTATVQALEEAFRVGALYWDHGEPVAVDGADDEVLVNLPGSLSTIDCWAIFKFVDGENFVIYVWPHVQITDRGSLDHSNSDLTIYEMTAKFIGDGYMITNNSDYVRRLNGEGGTDLPAGNGNNELPAGTDGDQGTGEDDTE